MYMRYLGLGVGHQDKHDDKSMEVEPLNHGVHDARDRLDELADYESEPDVDSDMDCRLRDEGEDQEEDSEHEDYLDDDSDEEHEGSEDELEEDLGYD
jgi:hypothetical protein